MTYSESAQGLLITRERVAQELARHGFTSADHVDECVAECRPRDRDGVTRWDAGDVLAWLGY